MLNPASMSAKVPTNGQITSYMRDLYNLSVNDYYGTARTMGMGNAVTATGGDIGTIPFNPAGGAVSHYSQVSLSPGISISTTQTEGTMSADGNTYLGAKMKTGQTRFVFPNGGFNINIDTPFNDVMKSFSFGWLANMSRNFNGAISARGNNKAGTSSLAGCLASQATDCGGIFSEGSLPYLAYLTDMIGTNDLIRPDGTFFGVNEWMDNDGSNSAYLEGDITQRFTSRTTGYKEDFIFNLAFNLKDMFYFGASLGVVSLRYDMTQNLSEAYDPDTCDPTQFHNVFNELGWSYNYSCSGVGVYGKFGFLFAPVAGLRIGFAIQTPTGFSISESYGNNVYNTYGEKRTSLSERANYRDIRYKITMPMRLNTGLAYTVGKVAVLSADYEFVNYSQSRYRAVYSEDVSWFEPVNEQIQGIGKAGEGCLGASHLLRVGVEVKPIPSVALRAGYNLTTSGTRYASDSNADSAKNLQAVTFGLGWSSSKSFFADVAARWNMCPYTYCQVYDNYSNRSTVVEKSKLIGGPVIQSKQDLITVTATLGWRF